MAGVVLSLDPKPIPVCLFLLPNSKKINKNIWYSKIHSITLFLFSTSGRLEWCRSTHKLQVCSGSCLYDYCSVFLFFLNWDSVLCSTKSMREDGGYEVIKKAIEKLGLRHKEHIAAYGEGNERRLTGKHETADINTFLWVRIFTKLIISLF